MKSKSYEDRMAIWQRNRFSPPPEKQLNPVEPTRIDMVPMRDGVKLYTEIFLPAENSAANEISGISFPVILKRSPYPYSRPSRHNKVISHYCDSGFAVVFQLTRGQGESEGRYELFRNDINDGYDCIQWIAIQEWSNGNVGMEGVSYLGNTQLLAARARPPALKCIMPAAFLGNTTRTFPFSCGVPNKGPYMQWHQVLDAERWDELDVGYGDMNALNHPKWGPAFYKRPLIDSADKVLLGDKLDAWRKTISNPMDDEYWRGVNFTDRELADLDLPIFFTDGWYDMTIGPIDFFTRLDKFSLRSDRYLLVGPWNHGQTYANSEPGETDEGGRTLPDNGACDLTKLRIKFFDKYLKGNAKTEVQKNRVRVYITGSPNGSANQWLDLPTFPAPSTEWRQLYLHSDGDARSFPGNGVLSWIPPQHEEAVDQYTYDPAVPTGSPTVSFKDRRNIEVRSDVLTYTSEPLEEALTVLGDISLNLYAASNAPDTDWFVLITEVFRDGRSISFHYAPPAFRARYREGFDKEVFLTPNLPVLFNIPMGPAGHQIAAGNRVRLSIFSSAFPEYDPNTNTGKEASKDTTMRTASQTIFHDPLRPSHLVLPVIEL